MKNLEEIKVQNEDTCSFQYLFKEGKKFLPDIKVKQFFSS